MKLWIKYVLGIALGIIAAFVLPVSSPALQNAVDFLSDLAIRFGRYTLLPLLFFTVAYAVYKLRTNKMLTKTYLWLAVVLLLSSLLLTLLGLASSLLVRLPRIPIPSEPTPELAAIDVKALLLRLVPYSSFATLHDGAYLLPALIFAALAGAGCASNQTTFKPIITLFEAAAKLCYAIMSFFLEFLMVAMIAVACCWTLKARVTFATGTFVPLTALLLADFVLVAVVIYPLILYIGCKERHPYKVLYASLCPIITAFFSGDANLALLVNLKHGRDSLGIHRRVNGVTYPLFAVFARGGSALVTIICFTMILRSYSKLGFNAGDLLWISSMTFALSFLSCAIPSGGAFVMLTIMCTSYGRGFDDGYQLLRVAAPLCCSFAAAFDAATAMFGSYFVAVKMRAVEHVALKHYV